MAMSPERLGQHFLSNSVWRQQIEDAIHIDGGLWVEIGPGHGEMTLHLAQRAGKVIAIELDQSLAAQLRKNTAPGTVEVIQGDVLAVDFAALTQKQPFSVYGNLPYYITSPILHRLFEYAEQIRAIHIVIQYEVALRIAALPGCRDYGYLSVISQWFSRPEIELMIPPEAFNPPPKVDSALVTLRTPGQNAHCHVNDQEAFFQFVKECFAHKRKTLRNNLRNRLGDATESILLMANLSKEARGEELTVAQFADLFNLVQGKQL
jgi:16S rRNA (adenine1518-N6/adenine1519-N6)-dimethyltransferase